MRVQPKITVIARKANRLNCVERITPPRHSQTLPFFQRALGEYALRMYSEVTFGYITFVACSSAKKSIDVVEKHEVYWKSAHAACVQILNGEVLQSERRIRRVKNDATHSAKSRRDD